MKVLFALARGLPIIERSALDFESKGSLSKSLEKKLEAKYEPAVFNKGKYVCFNDSLKSKLFDCAGSLKVM